MFTRYYKHLADEELSFAIPNEDPIYLLELIVIEFDVCFYFSAVVSGVFGKVSGRYVRCTFRNAF